MSLFHEFARPVEAKLAQFIELESQGKGILLQSQATRDELRHTYIESFPKAANPIFRERRVYDCNCCLNFVSRAGKALFLHASGELESIWDVATSGYYVQVAAKLSALVKRTPIVGSFMATELVAGGKNNIDNHDLSITWDHFYTKLPKRYAYSGPKRSQEEANITTTFALTNWDEVTVKTILELAETDTIYRGKSYVPQLKQALQLISDCSAYAFWDIVVNNKSAAHIKNSAIGNLVENYIKSGDLEQSVAKFEVMVAPHNYKRTSALVSPRQLKDARDSVIAAGLESALYRRPATIQDIPAAEVIYSLSASSVADDPFAQLLGDVSAKPTAKELAGVTKLSMEAFVTDILPSTKKVELLYQGKDLHRTVTLTTAVDNQAKPLFAWSSPIAWAYQGDVTDSVKQRVKAAGGNVNAEVRISLAWECRDDLDLHLESPTGSVYFGRKRHTHGRGQIELDVDMNAGYSQSDTPVENIYMNGLEHCPEGLYEVRVNNYSSNDIKSNQFTVEYEYLGEVKTFTYGQDLRTSQTLSVFSFRVRDGQITEVFDVNKALSTSGISKEVHGIQTQTFVPVEFIMNSPNHWDAEPNGLKHLFFILQGMKTVEPVRGFFNEYLRGDLQPFRKQFEMLGSVTKVVTENQPQLTGLGFNVQQEGSVILRVTGQTVRTYEITL